MGTEHGGVHGGSEHISAGPQLHPGPTGWWEKEWLHLLPKLALTHGCGSHFCGRLCEPCESYKTSQCLELEHGDVF